MSANYKKSRFNSSTFDFNNESVNKMAQLFPESVSDGKIDFDKLKSILSPNLVSSNEKYDFTWRGKTNASKLADRPEVNTTLVENHDKSKNGDSTDNVYIEGDNLEVLKLLQKSYKGKINMIYIDPPYNTGKDFVYHDNFHESYENYLLQTGQVDSEGNKTTTNKETNGRFHTDWLNMMYPRLKLARNLLSNNGVIFINIDDTEAFNLKKICDEIFGENNFLADIIWNSTKSVTNTALISGSVTHTITYFKNMKYFTENRTEFRIPDKGKGFSNPDNDSRGPWKADPFQVEGERKNQLYGITNPNTKEVYYPNEGSSWKNDKSKFDELINDNRIVFGKNGKSSPQRKRFLFEAVARGKVSKTLWDDVGTTTNGTNRVKELFGKKVFSNPKPVDLIKRMVQLGSNKDSIILDFFSGSSTTAEAVMQTNLEDQGKRKFIMVQLPENLEDSLNSSSNDNKQVITNALNYTKENSLPETLASIGEERINLSGKDLNNNLSNKIDCGFKVYELKRSNIHHWDDNPDHLEKQMELFNKSPFVSGSTKKNIAREIAIKSGIPLDITPTEHDGIYQFTSNSKEVFVVLGEYDINLFDYLKKMSKNDNSLVVINELDSGSEIKINLIDHLNQNQYLNNRFSLEWI